MKVARPSETSVTPNTKLQSNRIQPKYYTDVYILTTAWMWLIQSQYNKLLFYRGADKSLARPGRKQANVSVRMEWISSAPCLAGKETWWQFVSWFCWNRARPWHASKRVSFLVGLRTYKHHSTNSQMLKRFKS